MNIPERRIPDRLRREILDAPCAYCGGPWPTEVDHIVPFSRGGRTVRENLAPACEPCNREKFDSTPEEWRTWRASVGLPWPPKGRHGVIRELLDEALGEGSVAIADLKAELRRMSDFGGSS